MLSPIQIQPAKVSNETLHKIQNEAGAQTVIVIVANQTGKGGFTAEIATATDVPVHYATVIAHVLKALVEQGFDEHGITKRRKTT